MKRLLLFSIMLLVAGLVKATHIHGGTITYKKLGNTTYEIEVRLYRDCPVGTAQYPPLNLRIRDVNGNAFVPSRDVLNLQVDVISPVTPGLFCVTNPGFCLDEGIYRDTLTNMPPQPGGYHIYTDHCCINSVVQNIQNPLNEGYSFYAFIPDTTVAVNNNSPQWNSQPPVFQCQGVPMNYDYGATDSDGDSLVYAYYQPFNENAPTFPGGVATFQQMQWQGGYGTTNPCGGSALTMSPQTGLIAGTPQSQGQFMAGVSCSEYRNGILLSTIYRTFIHKIISCPQLPLALFGGPQTICLGNTVQFTDNSMQAFTYFWDFGDTAITTDTSNLQNPSWLYAQPGVYNVMLIINRNTPCADTAWQQLTVEAVYAQFTTSGPLVAGQPITFTDNSYTSTGAPIVLWSWDFGDSSPLNTQQSPVYTYNTPGTYNAVLTVLSANGCTDQDTVALTINLANGIAPQASNGFHIWPNPSDGQFTLIAPERGSIMVTDLAGRRLTEQYLPQPGRQHFRLPFEAGTYLLVYRGETAEFVQKLVIR